MSTTEDKINCVQSSAAEGKEFKLLSKNGKKVSPARAITETAVMSAMLVIGKLALSFIPNVEVVTTLTILFGVCFGLRAVAASVVFCTADMFLYAFSLDVAISYYLYWPLLCLSAAVLSALKVKSLYVYLIVALIGTLFFGLLTSLVFSLLYGVPFIPVYVAGLPFYAFQLVSSLVFMLVGFNPLTKVLKKLM